MLKKLIDKTKYSKMSERRTDDELGGTDVEQIKRAVEKTIIALAVTMAVLALVLITTLQCITYNSRQDVTTGKSFSSGEVETRPSHSVYGNENIVMGGVSDKLKTEQNSADGANNTGLVVTDSMTEHRSQNLVQFGLIERGWRQDAVDGAITLFAGTTMSVLGSLITACAPSFLDFFGVIMPQTMLLRLSVCAWALSLAAVVAYVGSVVQAHRANGGWQFDGGSGTASERKRSMSILSEVYGDVGVYYLYDGLYLVNGMMRTDNVLNKRDNYAEHDIYVNSLAHVNDTVVTHIAYTFNLMANDHNKTVVAGVDTLDDAVQTWLRCGTEKYCKSNREVWLDANLTQLAKRSSGDWASYNDWGYDGGYLTDWWQWDEFKKAANLVVGDTSNMAQFQPCTNDERCYAGASKICLAGGLSSNRGDKSAWVGEVYMNAYGGIDGECFNG